MSQVSQISLIEVFEVVKEGFHDIFVEVIIWKQFAHGHKNGVAPLIFQKLLYLTLFLV